MKPLIILISLFALVAFGEDVNFGWKNGINPNATTNWQSVVYVSTIQNPGPSNFIASAAVQWPKTNATVVNIPSGTKTYTQVYHFDLEDLSDPSNQIYYKTKMNAPQQATRIP